MSDEQRKKIVVSVPQQYRAVSDGVWADLETYLFQGFLTSPAFLLGKTFVFKTVNHLEVACLAHLRPLRKSPMEVRSSYQASFMAHSILAVDGENVLHRRADHVGKLIRILRKMPPEVQEEVVRNLSSLNERALRLHPLTEVYVHESRSRFRWLYLRGSPVHSSLSTGMSGTDVIGMNHVQQTWTALNRLLDQREEMDADWVNAKFVGSCFNGKGVRSVDERDRSRREKERQDREDLKMKVLFRYLNRKSGSEEEPPAQVQLPDGRMAEVVNRFRAETVEELADQLSAALSGEKDHHDKVVERRMGQLQEMRDRMEVDRMRIYSGSALRPEPAAAGSVPIHGSSRVLGGREEAEAQLRRMRAMRDGYLAKTVQKPPDIQDPRQSSDEGSEDGA